ncbi:MAG: hypothetical protein ACJ76Y_10470 [Thermoanaerobaculia bacterium]
MTISAASVLVISEDLVGCPRISHGQPGAVQGDLVELVGQRANGPLPVLRNQDDHLGWTFRDIFGQPEAEGVILLDAAVEFDGSHVTSRAGP